jgi:hypothetical protein
MRFLNFTAERLERQKLYLLKKLLFKTAFPFTFPLYKGAIDENRIVV